MPKKGGYVCECGSVQGNPDRLRKHKARFCGLSRVSQEDTTGGGAEGNTLQEGNTEGNTGRETREIPNPITELSPEQAQGNTGNTVTHGSSSSVLPEREGETCFPPVFPSDRRLTTTKCQEAVKYIDEHIRLLSPEERRIFTGIAYRVRSGANHLTDAQTDWLLSLEVMTRDDVELIEAERKIEMEDRRRKQHFFMRKEPDHVRCDLCIAEDEDRERCRLAVIREAEELMEMYRREQDELQASRKGEDAKPGVPQGPPVTSLQAEAAHLVPGPVSGSLRERIRANLDRGRKGPSNG